MPEEELSVICSFLRTPHFKKQIQPIPFISDREKARCLRAWKEGYKVILSLDVDVIHDARRTSHKNLKYMKWHITSMIRFFILHIGRFPNKVL